MVYPRFHGQRMKLSELRITSMPRGVAIPFACALLVVILQALVSQYVINSVAETTRDIDLARARLDQLDEARELLIDAETGVRGFLLIGRPEYLDPYNSAAAPANEILADIARDSSPADRAQTEQFASLARAKLEELRRTLEVYRTGDRDKAVETIASGSEKRSMDIIRELVRSRREALEERVESARAQSRQLVRWALLANVLAATLALVVLVFFGSAMARHLFRRQELEQRIQGTNIELEQKVAQRTQELEDAVDAIRTQLTEVEQREELLPASEQRFKLLVAGVKDYAFFMLDPEGHISSWNAGAERIKGYSENEIIGKHFSIFYTPEDRSAGVPRNALQTAVETGKYEAESWRVRKDGSLFFASVVIDPLRDGSGQLVGFAKITRDVTERRQHQIALDEAKAALAQSQKMEALGQLSGGVAHDFNNLLGVIKNCIELLNRQLKDANAETRQPLDMITRNADRAASLTQRMLAFSRRQPLDPKPLEPNRLISELTELLHRTLGEAVALETVLGSGVWPVAADAPQLETALLNLAVNARDAMPNGGKITIETANCFLDEAYARTNKDLTPGQYVMIAVSDTGTGMSKEVIAKAFDPFFTTKETGQGTGLGLSQVYGFIKQSGGHVKIYNPDRERRSSCICRDFSRRGRRRARKRPAPFDRAVPARRFWWSTTTPMCAHQPRNCCER
jgi:PAS domain S-box-containing protein